MDGDWRHQKSLSLSLVSKADNMISIDLSSVQA